MNFHIFTINSKQQHTTTPTPAEFVEDGKTNNDLMVVVWMNGQQTCPFYIVLHYFSDK